MTPKAPAYYLDTNVIRALSKRLIPLVQQASVFTSPLTLIEIMSGMTSSDNAFKRRASALRAIVDSGLTIGGDFPDVAIQKAFQIPLDEQAKRFNLEMLDCLEVLVDIAIRSPDRESFTTAEREVHLSFGSDFFTLYDNGLGKRFIEASIAGHREIKKNFDSEEELAFSIGAQTLQEFCNHLNTDLFWMNYEMTLVALYDATVRDTKTTTASSEHPFNLAEEAKSHYICAIDTFVKAFAHRTTEMLAGQQVPHRNDLLDLFHLIYVTPGITLVTDDKKLRTTLEATSPKVSSLAKLTVRS